jgi:peptidoglycan/xylan/chitin deacetylase (PgdA/CDA1 family)
MELTILNKVKRLFKPKAAPAIVLMYHRVAELESDVWELAVSPKRFEQHLKVLKKMGNAVPLEQLSSNLNSGLYRNNIAITFDDGYCDNFTNAKPLLEKYKLPATFFITTKQVESGREFWWDELEHIFLFTPQLPSTFSLVINDKLIASELGDETWLAEECRCAHRLWKACTETPPTRRAELFYSVWEQIKPLPFTEQEAYLDMIRNWAGSTGKIRADYSTMSVSELKQMAANNLFTIGAHTLTHPALSCHSDDFQSAELSESRKILQEQTGQEISTLAYPYGDHNENTAQIAYECGFGFAFTTDERSLKPGSHPYRLGRFQVKNLTGTEFEDQLKKWRSE